METIQQIHEEVREEKPCSRPAIYTYLKKLKIKPQGARQSPQLYPVGTGKRIINYLTGNGHSHRGIVPLAELKQLRPKAGRAK